jgi:hypothetical protein
MRTRPFALLLAVGSFTAGLGCSDPGELGRCDPPLQLTVRTTPVYEFEWGPAGCDVHTLTVEYEGVVQWHLFTIEIRNGLTSPIRYGMTPEGARSSNAESLLSGRRYTIVLTRITEAGLERVVVQQDFNTP